MVHGALALILFVEGEVELVASGDVHMKRNFRVVAVAALLACMVATDALAAGHGGGFGAGGFAGAHMGRGFGGPFPGGITSTPAPVLNPSSPYTRVRFAGDPSLAGKPGISFWEWLNRSLCEAH
jgi:hypothetical protein